MKHIVVGTNRPQSNSRKVAEIIQKIYRTFDEEVEIIDLREIPLELLNGSFYGQPLPAEVAKWVEKVNHSEGLIMVVPEYNGSIPGALKYFIDFWKYPEAFEHRPVCFVGLGGLFGGLRPVEHLQQVFGYRNAFLYPDRVFLINVWKNLNTQGELTDTLALGLLKQQASGFQAFCRGLDTEKLDARHLELKRQAMRK